MILFLDDECTTDLFLDELRGRGLPVCSFSQVDTALDYVHRTSDVIEIAVIDVMMPPGDSFTLADTQDGLTTGIHFYKSIRKKLPDCIVFFLTNLTRPEIYRCAESDNGVRIRTKTDVFYDEFADEVQACYESGK